MDEQKLKILLVEDNEMNRDMLSRRLRRNNYDVTIAIDGQEGIDFAAANPPDLILMDMSLPKVDGWEATRRLKAIDGLASVPIIAPVSYTHLTLPTNREV